MVTRRVVTGHSPDGDAIFIKDDVLPEALVTTDPGRPGFSIQRVWRRDEPASYPDDGAEPPLGVHFPPLHGSRFIIVTFPPDKDLPPLDDDAVGEFYEKITPGAEHGGGVLFDKDEPAMHTSASTDYQFVVAGRLVLELDNGASVTLSAGDTVVQNGTRHAWHNPFDEPAVLCASMVGAHHAKIPS